LGTNNGIVFDEETKIWKATGDPTESALAVFAQKVGFHKDVLEKESPRLSEIPFDYKNKYHAAMHKVDGGIFTTVIGAPEEILNLASKVWHDGKSHPLTAEKKKELESDLVGMYGKGLRVLACAVKDKTSEELKPKDITELTLVGFLD